MADNSPLSFDELVENRRTLQDFCYAQYDGITAFKDGPSFKVYLDNDVLASDSAHHLSSSATCYESVLDCPRNFLRKSQPDLEKDAATFAGLALKREGWTSDGSAPIYCRCRTLPLVIRFVKSDVDKLATHIATILKQLSDSRRLAVGEAPGSNQRDWYPPNAYHTYWALAVLEAFHYKFANAREKIESAIEPASLERLQAEMLLWAHEAAAFQVGLHSVDSPALDSDQLAWAIAILFRFGHGFDVDIGKQDFIRAALNCLFARQNSVGIWRTGRPLFHYKNSGNAHCYVFETFSVLLKAVLTTRDGTVFLRQALQPYARNLLKLFNYALSTRIPLQNGADVFAWSSGHRPNRKEPESWATASVYAYGNSLRRLVGIWTREVAVRELGVSTERGSAQEAIKTIVERGDTWSPGHGTAATQLLTLFVNPVLSRESVNSLEPDNEPIRDDQARGAILFGPPGTSKTKLSRSVARAIGWNYVELHASHFVAAGLPEVQRTADRIFKQLMQLDQTVILFDEIDELVREREGKSDTFGRFLTTSMLPKLAELWERRSVIYFVATNHIDYFDSAIVRAQRFDAIVHVPPPSFVRKVERLRALLEEQGVFIPFNVPQSSIEAALTNFDVADTGDDESEKSKGKARLNKKQSLAKFLLIRWDQLDELAANITRAVREHGLQRVDIKSLNTALQQMSDPFLDEALPYIRYLRSVEYERRDFSKAIVWQVDPAASLKRGAGFRLGNGKKWFDTYDFRALPPEFMKTGADQIGLKNNISSSANTAKAKAKPARKRAA
jgi:hypothetical protein